MVRKKKQHETLAQFMNHLIDQKKADGRYRTMLHYQATLNSIFRFLQHQAGEAQRKLRAGRHRPSLLLRQIDAKLVHSYEAYLRNVARVCRNTSSFYLRVFRAVYNRAVGQGILVQQHPFRGVYTGIDKTGKRSIPAHEMSRIKQLAEPLSSEQELARDVFLMCFYLRGISFIDLAHLLQSDIHDGYLSYVRSKTGQRLSVKWEPAMQAIVDKYRHLCPSSSPYLFPFLVAGGKQQAENRRLYHNAEARIAYHLKRVGELAGTSCHLTLYVARHTWATIARDSHYPVSVISQALGHDSEWTTQIYLRSIQSSEVDKANAAILASL